MTIAKPAASLTAGLLARKGMAQPAMRRQTVTGLGPRAVTPLDDLGWNDMGEDRGEAIAPINPAPVAPTPITPASADAEPYTPAPSPVALHIAAIQETLDRRRAERRASEPAAPAPLAAQPPVAPQEPLTPQEPMVQQAPAPRALRAKASAKAARQPKAKSAFTLRIDADRHLRLRLLSAVTNRSAQQLLIGALDALIARHPHIDALAANPNLRRASDDTGME
ncbi:hypothetical protein LWE61_18255 [Sphingobium sufflavum]|uniref:hypothetical protein n=1 Tax=Sphingobium sufflavum TaxID=1129547 RepID=UPI001F402515|nr:hypothetical protein [Sphingobium sufflavum]MCE7798485.1 hypothetical protein [Sphingobium sufflavum]